ncbi:MAG: hypothetical protein FWD61_08835, partial [Phycisphaerales bacterium]|nr:hypothetical protein [Phycisphaerales bacterium]
LVCAGLSVLIPTIFYWLAPWLVPWLSPQAQQFMLWLTLIAAILAIILALAAGKSWQARTAMIWASACLILWLLMFIAGELSQRHLPAKKEATAATAEASSQPASPKPVVTFIAAAHYMTANDVSAWQPDGSPLPDKLQNELRKLEAIPSKAGNDSFFFIFLVKNPPDPSVMEDTKVTLDEGAYYYGSSTLIPAAELGGTLVRIGSSRDNAKSKDQGSIRFGLPIRPWRTLLEWQVPPLPNPPVLTTQHWPFPGDPPKIAMRAAVFNGSSSKNRLPIMNMQGTEIRMPMPSESEMLKNWGMDFVVRDHSGAVQSRVVGSGGTDDDPRFRWGFDISPSDIASITLRGLSLTDDYLWTNIPNIPLQPNSVQSPATATYTATASIRQPIEFRLERASYDSTSLVDEVPEPFHPGRNGKLYLLKTVYLDQSAIAFAAFDPTPTNIRPSSKIKRLTMTLFFTPAGAQAFAKIPRDTGPGGDWPLRMLFNGQVFTIPLAEGGVFPDRCIVYLPNSSSRADAEEAVAAINKLVKAPASRNFTSFAQVLDGLPADALPDPKDGWDQFSQSKTNKWLNDNITLRGYPVTFTAALVRVGFERVFPQNNPNDTLYWIVEYDLYHLDVDFQGHSILAFVDSYSDPGSTQGLSRFRSDCGSNIIIAGDEAFARAAQALPAGTLLTFRGTISKAEVREQNPPKIRFLLSDPSLISATAATQPATTQAASVPLADRMRAARLKEQAAAEALDEAEAKWKAGRITPMEYEWAKAARDIVVAERRGDSAEVALIKWQLAEKKLKYTREMVDVGKASSEELRKAKLARDLAAAATQPAATQPAKTP